MKIIVPDYFERFRCIAGACRHSCCIGWEIDIDEKTCAQYKSVDGPFGERLMNSIEWGQEPHFRLGEHERCPFLNKDNLCDIIINLGEDCLCQICSDHPRYRSFFESRTEMGLGLCCEAAAELILNNPQRVELIALEDDGAHTESENESDFFAFRDGVISVLQDRRKSIAQRIDEVLSGYGVTMPQRSMAAWAQIYSSLERLDSQWDEKLSALAKADGHLCTVPDVVHEQLLVYFAFRHISDGLYDGLVKQRIAFAILSAQIVCAISSVCGEPVTEIARMYSAEIEYSDENIDALLETL